MFPELLRFSSSSRLLTLVPEEILNAHRAKQNESTSSLSTAVVTKNAASTSKSLWDDWQDAEQSTAVVDVGFDDDDDDDVDLSEIGL